MKMKTVYMWGYLPGALPQRAPIMSPVEVRHPQSADAVEFWVDVCGGGCGFAMAISDTRKLITWGSTDDLGQSYVTSGKHGETPEPFPLPNDVSLVKAAAGWAHCVCVTVSPANSEGSKSTDVVVAHETRKRRRVTSTSQAGESSSSGDEDLSALPCLVAFMYPGIWDRCGGWGYGGEGQLGLGSRIRMVSSPRYIPCIAASTPGTYVTRIACGGRHSAVITDAGALVTFGWGLYGQCGQGSTDDELSPTCVSSMLGIRIDGVAAGLWHTICISGDGNVYAFGGNQFGQLGTGTDQAETLPRLLDAPNIENEHARVVSCGARHSAIVTDEKVFCWGWNKYGQLGVGDLLDRNIPSQVDLDGFVPRAVACGWWHTLVLAESLT
ncbi:ultraviolet-B receptor UVR8-like [Bidens hawaiensis]|uniref:ultraviolet-B receptor UVR8-like n=1 Tax=Bidens hawaiensis TaxID=980011 RepID=UPI00404B8E21